MYDAIDFDHYEDAEVFAEVDDLENKYRFRGLNRDRVKKRERDRMILNGNQLKTVIIPLLGKKARDQRDKKNDE